MTPPIRAAWLSLALVSVVLAPRAEAAEEARVLWRARLERPPLERPPRLPLPRGGTTSMPRGELPLGSIFSGLFRDPADPELTFWCVTDRGPNGQLLHDGVLRRTFAAPDFQPRIIKVRVSGEPPARIEIVQQRPLRRADGRPVSGLPNHAAIDERPYDQSGRNVLPYDSGGLDPEDLVRLSDGSFWVAEEYGPSLVRVSPNGQVRARVAPVGRGLVAGGFLVREELPSVLGRRQANRGFESLALSGDGRTLYAASQSPLFHPDAETGLRSRILRVFAFDATDGRPTAEHAVVLEPAAAFGEAEQDAVKVSGLAWAGEGRLLVAERSDLRLRLQLVDLRQATNLLGSSWDDIVKRPALEALEPEALAAAGVVVAAKELVLDVSELVPDAPAKLEGLALIDASTVVVGNDNEYGVAGWDPKLRPVLAERPSELIAIRLARPLPLPESRSGAGARPD